MENIQIEKIRERKKGWNFTVSIDERSYEVSLSEQYYREITDGEMSPRELVTRSFEFLLDREPASAILSEFELPVIQRYFSDYEKTIKKLASDR